MLQSADRRAKLIQRRYAVLSAIPYWLCEAFNRNIEKSLHRDAPPIMDNEMLAEMERRSKLFEEVPEWVKRVPKLEEKLVIQNGEGSEPGERYLCLELGRMGIVAEAPNVLFV